MTLRFKVKVEGLLPPNAIMAMTGNTEETGYWEPHACRPMECIHKTAEEEIWYTEFEPRRISGNLEFRYVMIENEDAANMRRVKVIKWETRLKPRCIHIQDFLTRTDPPIHKFGTFGGETKIQRGWLTGQTEVHLRVYGESFKWFKPRHRGRRAYLRVHQLRCLDDSLASSNETPDLATHPMDEETTEDANGQPTMIIATVSCLGADSEPRIPDLAYFQGAVLHTDKDYHTFRMQTWNLDCMCIEIDVLVGSLETLEEEEEPRVVGTARLAQFERLQGVKWLHVYGNNRRVIGQVKVDFLIIQPLRDYCQTTEVSFCNYWRFIRTLSFGHRGSGSDKPNSESGTCLKENTLNSLRSAFEHGADYVEFDVHLSKDRIPVVYHDFSVALTLRKKKRGDLGYVKVAVKDLTMDELQNLKVSHTAVLNEAQSKEHMEAEQSEQLDSLVFLTLAQVFEHFDQDDDRNGFNIEIKYPQMFENGQHELENYYERNEFLDIILRLILKKAGRRRILLSSFDADICTMINLKQNKYPVVFLTQGINTVYPYFMDLRTRSHTMSIWHAVDSGILGVNLYHQEVFNNTKTVLTLARSKKLVVILWGEELNKNSVQKQLKALNLDGIVFDRIQEHHQKGHLNVFRSTGANEWPSDVFNRLGVTIWSSADSVQSEGNSSNYTSSLSDNEPSAKLAKTDLTRDEMLHVA